MKGLDRADKIIERIHSLGKISENPDCLTRTFGSPAFLQGSRKIMEWMQEAGLNTRIDNIGNVRGRLESPDPSAKTLLIGSHMDTVTNAGKFDGPLGVIIAIELLEEFKKRNEITFPFTIECVAFSDEEGARFHTTFLGSKVITGKFDEVLLSKFDHNGTTLQEAIVAMNCDPTLIRQDFIPADELMGYFEIHIEQGPVLFESKIPVAYVNGIAAQKRIEIKFSGFPGHAGTVPMNMRKDALCAAAECITSIESFAKDHQDFVATVGKLEILNSASNVIPGKISSSLDIRSIDLKLLNENCDLIKKLCTDICGKRSIDLQWNLVQETSPVICDATLNGLLKTSIKKNGHPLIGLTSGAGHDAVEISKVTPVSMLFVRCFEGISHNPLENVEIMDIAAALQVSEDFLLALAATTKNLK